MKFKTFLLGIILTSILCFSGTAFAMTDAERATLIAQLQAQIAALQAQLIVMIQEQQSSTTWCHTFTETLISGNTGAEVYALQTVLQKQGYSIASLEIQSTLFGATTKQAVINFQNKYASEVLTPLGLSNGTGTVGLLTRTKLNELYGCNGSSSSTATCNPSWSCGSWSTCSYGYQTRSCYDTNYCNSSTNKPSEQQSCTAACTPNWSCGSWNTCSSGYQSRTCYDTNYCGVTTNKPSETQTCASTCTPSWSCGSWSTCSYGYQTRSCYDTNYCGNTINAPSQYQTCNVSTCTPSWSCGSWSSCANNQQTRTCYDTNFCGDETNEPNEYQSCTSNISGNLSVDLKANGSDSTVTLISGTAVSLTWSSANVSSCSASSNLGTSSWSGTKSTSGVVSVPVNSSNTYVITCTDSSGNSVEDSVTVNVVSVDLKVNGVDTLSIPYNSATALVLTWSSTGATSCTASTNIGNSYWSGSQSISGNKTLGQLTASTIFTIACNTSSGNTVSDSVSINVTKPTVSLKINNGTGPVYANYGDTASLTWSSTNATSCTASATSIDGITGWTGNASLSGSYAYAQILVKENTYTMTCKDSAGNKASSSVVARMCKYDNYGAIGYYNGVYGAYENICTGGQMTKYVCISGKVVEGSSCYCKEGTNICLTFPAQ